LDIRFGIERKSFWLHRTDSQALLSQVSTQK